MVAQQCHRTAQGQGARQAQVIVLEPQPRLDLRPEFVTKEQGPATQEGQRGSSLAAAACRHELGVERVQKAARHHLAVQASGHAIAIQAQSALGKSEQQVVARLHAAAGRTFQ